jgi:hypothetical protein
VAIMISPCKLHVIHFCRFVLVLAGDSFYEMALFHRRGACLLSTIRCECCAKRHGWCCRTPWYVCTLKSRPELIWLSPCISCLFSTISPTCHLHLCLSCKYWTCTAPPAHTLKHIRTRPHLLWWQPRSPHRGLPWTSRCNNCTFQTAIFDASMRNLSRTTKILEQAHWDKRGQTLRRAIICTMRHLNLETWH